MFERTEEQEALCEAAARAAREILGGTLKADDEAELFRPEYLQALGEVGLCGIHIPEEFGGLGLGYLEYAMVLEEIGAVSASYGVSVAVTGLPQLILSQHGSAEQQERWLPGLAAGELLGGFALSEPESGSDAASLQTTAVRKGDHYVLNGSKYWITNGSMAHVAIVWAKLDGVVRGFLVDCDTPGFQGKGIKNKFSLRASDTSELVLEDVRIPKANLLPGVEGLKGPLSCLTQARYGIAFGAVGAAQAAYDEATRYSQMRIMFDKPIGRYQLVQNKLVWMANEITKAQLLCWKLGKMKEQGKMQHYHVSLAKRNSCWMALECCRMGRDVLGANGITDEYQMMRHMCNLESVITYEGTHDIHTLIVGRQLTGLDAIF